MQAVHINYYFKTVANTDKIYEDVKWMIRKLDPFYFLAKWRVDKVIAINSSLIKVWELILRK